MPFTPRFSPKREHAFGDPGGSVPSSRNAGVSKYQFHLFLDVSCRLVKGKGTVSYNDNQTSLHIVRDIRTRSHMHKPLTRIRGCRFGS